MKILFDTFLENPKVYLKVENYWEKIIRKIANAKQLTFHWAWRNTFLPNGAKMYDGDPIATAYFPSLKKGVRIIQRDPKDDDIYKITGWVSKTEYDREDIIELVIVIQLSKETKKIAEQLIREWVIANADLDTMSSSIAVEAEKFRLGYYNIYGKWLQESKEKIPFNFIKEKLQENFQPLKTQKDYIECVVKLYGDTNLSQIKATTYSQKYFRATKIENPFYLDCWLKIASYLAEKEQINVFSFENEKILINTLKKELLTATNLVSTMQKVLNEFGIKFLFMPVPKKVNIDGAIFWQGENPVIVLVNKYKEIRNDYFVFTLFHELGHLFKHIAKEQTKFRDQTKFFVDNTSNITEDTTEIEGKEIEANNYAQNNLINSNYWNEFVKSRDFSENSIIKFAEKLSIPTYIIKGRLTFDNKRDFRATLPTFNSNSL
jgi:Zn-dependent peptidase ImmA (M78 family)